MDFTGLEPKDFEHLEGHFVKTKYDIITFSEVGSTPGWRRQGERVEYDCGEIFLFDSLYFLSNERIDAILIDSTFKIRYFLNDINGWHQFSLNQKLEYFNSIFEVID